MFVDKGWAATYACAVKGAAIQTTQRYYRVCKKFSGDNK